MNPLIEALLGRQNVSLLTSHTIAEDPAVKSAARKLREKLAKKRLRLDDEKLAAALAALRSNQKPVTSE